MSKKSFVTFLILSEILALFLILFFNIGMFGFDAYIHLQYCSAILENKHILELSIAKSYYDFVGFHIFISAIASLTSIPVSAIYEFASVIVPILVFNLTIIAFIRHVEKKRKGYISNGINLQYLSLVLLFPSLIGIQMFFGRPNSLGIAFFSLCLYLYLCKTKSFKSQLLAGLLVIVTVKIHHLSAIFLLPVIFFTSIFLASNYKTILSLIYTFPAVVVVNTILNSREFSIVNFYLSKNENYVIFYNIFISNLAVFLIVWLALTLLGYIVRSRYQEKIVNFFAQRKFSRKFFILFIGSITVLEVVGLYLYTTQLSSWYISVELTILFILSGIALLPSNKVRNSLFTLGFIFYGLTVMFSLVFSSTQHELSWIAPRTFIFAIIFFSILSYVSISDLLIFLKKKWVVLFIPILLFNVYVSFSYMGSHYIPEYNLNNSYENLTFAYWIEANTNTSTLAASIPFSIAKFIGGVDIYRLQVLLDIHSTISQNTIRLTSSYLTYITIGAIMDQWLGPPLRLSSENITYYINTLYYNQPTFHCILSNGKNCLMYNW